MSNLDLCSSSSASPLLACQHQGAAGTVISEFYGKSEKGYAPYNPRKANQDVYDQATDDVTGSMLFLVMDGHGGFGHKVKQHASKRRRHATS